MLRLEENSFLSGGFTHRVSTRNCNSRWGCGAGATSDCNLGAFNLMIVLLATLKDT